MREVKDIILTITSINEVRASCTRIIPTGISHPLIEYVTVSLLIVENEKSEKTSRAETAMKLNIIAQLSFLPAIRVIRNAVSRGIII
jgi:hypothetical protein